MRFPSASLVGPRALNQQRCMEATAVEGPVTYWINRQSCSKLHAPSALQHKHQKSVQALGPRHGALRHNPCQEVAPAETVRPERGTTTRSGLTIIVAYHPLILLTIKHD